MKEITYSILVKLLYHRLVTSYSVSNLKSTQGAHINRVENSVDPDLDLNCFQHKKFLA